MSVTFKTTDRRFSSWIESTLKKIPSTKNKQEIIELFGSQSAVVASLFEQGWFAEDVPPEDLLGSIDRYEVRRRGDVFLHLVDYGELGPYDEDVQRWFDAVLGALGWPQRGIDLPPDEPSGVLAQCVEDQAPYDEPWAEQSGSAGQRYVLGLLAPRYKRKERMALGDNLRIRLVERLRVEIGIPYKQMWTLAYGDSAEGDEKVENGTHLVQLIKGYGGYLGCGPIHLQMPGPLTRALESAIATSLQPEGAASFRRDFLEGFAVGQGIEIHLLAVAPLDTAGGVRRFQKTEVHSGLTEVFEAAVGVEPECVLLEREAYEGADWAEFRGGRTRALTDLLKERGCELTAAKANRVLLSKGVLVERERPSASEPGRTKKFKALTGIGLRYGVNVVNPNAPGETSPKYYPALFDELLEKFLAT